MNKTMVMGGLALVGVLGWQQWNVHALRLDLHRIQRHAGRPTASTPVQVLRSTERVHLTDPSISDRLASLERSVTELTRVAEYLAERGAVPLSTNRMADMSRKVADPNLPDAERLQALRGLRRSRGLDDETVQAALTFFGGSTNSSVRENILDQLEGATNSAARAVFLEAALKDGDSEVREQAVDNLRRFMADPQVEASLWHMAHNDPNPKVREEADEALREGQMTSERATLMTQRVLDPQSTLDQKLLAMRALQRAGPSTPEVSAVMVDLVQSAQDPVDRARIFGALDGTRDPNMMAPLVNGLQDPNPVIRERAADALSDMKTDPAVAQWLRHVAANDSDPRVRREALQALEVRR